MNSAVRFTVKQGVHIERAMYGQQQILIDSNTNLAEGQVSEFTSYRTGRP
jgi:hypothetical protein